MSPHRQNDHNNDVENILDDVDVPLLPLTYDAADSNASATELIIKLRPEWASSNSKIEFVRFTDGITNTLLKAVNRRDGLSKEEIDKEAVLLRAYGHGTDVLIDRHRETQNHELLMKYGLAPELLARFNNGMLYRFIRGSVTQPADLRRPEIYKAVARRLAEWHARVPCLPDASSGNVRTTNSTANRGSSCRGQTDHRTEIDNVAPGKPHPNVWTVMQKWIFALPTETQVQRDRQSSLQVELDRLVSELSQRPGLGKDGLVFAHCDLLSGNIIVLPKSANPSTGVDITVSFIDYEYAVPSPAAFDIANHFAEWGGFDCDFSVLPTRSQRREFIRAYTSAYYAFKGSCTAMELEEKEVENMMKEVDVFRGVPGFYWGIWALIQATISEIDFDYASYAEVRLSEYWAWRGEVGGTRETAGEKEMPLRERRWATECD